MARTDNLYSRVLDKASKMLSPRDNAKYEALPRSECNEDIEASGQPPMDNQLCCDEELEQLNETHSCLQVLLGWTCLVLAVIAGASIGPVFKYMMSRGIGPLLASSWRNQAMVLSLLPVTLWEAFSKKENKVDWFQYKPDLPYPVIVHVIISGLSWAANLLFWVVGLKYVTTFKASIVASSHPVLLVIAMQFTGSSVSVAEWAGVLVSFGGMFISEYRPSSEGVEKDPTADVPFRMQMVGYFFCLLAAAGEVVTIMNRLKTRKYVPLMQYTLSTSIFVMIMASVLSVVLEGATLFEDGQLCFSDACVLGWISPTWWFKVLMFGLVIGAVCITGFNYSVSTGWKGVFAFRQLLCFLPALTLQPMRMADAIRSHLGVRVSHPG